ncbi:putative stage III sporulation protein E [Leptospira ryugenii]|uniref:Putative stage III sporulation protein E n=1 Tax=Leptospira ryugenii TaxID=1917863 RepID=A0A2P2DY27_9LEPT|nr:DNA translocase FtsK 4TM domain-containing protein [Leptospira ryugenii]GBF49527.1 putative stage III sporulation protein E [Leptospira ryugenii]
MEKERSIPTWHAFRQDLSPYAFVFFGVFLLLSLFSFTEGDDGSLANWFGRIGYYVSFTLLYLFGKAAFFLAGFALVLGVISFKNPDFDRLGKALYFPLLLVASSVSLQILETPMGKLGDGGGIIGMFFSWLLQYLFGETGRIIVVFFLYIYSAIVWLEDSAWGFTVQKLNGLSQGLLGVFGAKRDLSHLRIPKFLSDLLPRPSNVGVHSGLESPLRFETSSEKGWFEKKVIAEEAPEAPVLTLPKVERKKNNIQYKNANLYDGFFEETGFVYRMDANRKERNTISQTSPFSAPLYRFVDLREERKEEVEQRVEDSSWKLPLTPVSDLTSLKKKTPIVDFSDLELYEREGGDWEEEDLILDEEEPMISEEEWEEEEELLDLDLEAKEASEAPDTEHEEDSVEESEIEVDHADVEEPLSIETIPVAETEILPPSNVYMMEEKKKKTKEVPREEEFPFGSMVPSVRLKKGRYYISSKLLLDHKPSLLHTSRNESEVETVVKKIEEILGHFGIEVKVISKERGPIITRYELTIPYGVKLSKVTTLVDEIRGHLEVTNVRIVAPIPGKSTIGIEVPNQIREDVYLSEILKAEALQSNKAKGLSISIGKDISGKIVNIDLAKLPHLLVAGTTGSGKSVSLNAMITSLICTRSPEEVRFIMIDPKMVEMTLYEDIPHLLVPVITDPRKASKALAWAIDEMESRYQIVSKLKSRDFKSYNEKVEQFAHAQGYQKFPYIVIFIDELADLMMVSGKELEEKIQRISQKSRAVGIHLVMATQRPSVDVITGLIKANCPARVAFKVAQKTDSRTILDSNGAESLLGKGDFLYRSPEDSDLIRIQAPFVEEKEIEAIVEEAKKQGSPAYIEIDWEDEGSAEEIESEDEDLFQEAWNIVLTEKKASASYLQRRMRIGYNKAARLMELMEARGYVSPQIGAKPREILRSA